MSWAIFNDTTSFFLSLVDFGVFMIGNWAYIEKAFLWARVKGSAVLCFALLACIQDGAILHGIDEHVSSGVFMCVFTFNDMEIWVS